MKYFRDIFREREEVSVRYDAEDKAVWLYLNPKDRPRLSFNLVKSILEVSRAIRTYYEKSSCVDRFAINFYVVASQTKGIFNYGGDLEYFIKLVENGDRDELYSYTKLCVDNVYLFNKNLDLPLETIAFVQGTALGGGFELVLSCSTVIAEKSAKMGFPESRFNLFPGVGGYTFLAQMYGIRVAEEMIGSGKIYSSDELFEKGIIDELADDGNGFEYIKRYMKRYNRNFQSRLSLLQARKIHTNLSYDELTDIAKMWMNMVINLDENSIRMIKRLINAQDGKNINHNIKLRTFQDRRVYVDDALIKRERRKVADRRSA